MPSYQHVCDKERFYIWQARREGHTQKHIAEALGRYPSTICRELEQNTYAQCHMYAYYWARHTVKFRKSQANQHKARNLTDDIAPFITQLRRQYLSPEQVSGYLTIHQADSAGVRSWNTIHLKARPSWDCSSSAAPISPCPPNLFISLCDFFNLLNVLWPFLGTWGSVFRPGRRGLFAGCLSKNKTFVRHRDPKLFPRRSATILSC